MPLLKLHGSGNRRQNGKEQGLSKSYTHQTGEEDAKRDPVLTGLRFPRWRWRQDLFPDLIAADAGAPRVEGSR